MSGHRVALSHRALMLAAGVLLPLLLAIPPVFMLTQQTADLRAAEYVVQTEIQRVDPTIVDIKDLRQLHSLLLLRRGMLAEMDRGRPQIVRLLNVLGDLPKGVQLDEVSVKGNQLRVSGLGAEPALSAALSGLRSAGLTDIVVSQHGTQTEGHSGPAFELRADCSKLSAVDSEYAEASAEPVAGRSK